MAVGAAFLLQCGMFMAANSQTVDEAIHLAAGYSYLARRDFRLNTEHPPLVKLLSALPVFIWYDLPFEPQTTDWQTADQARIGLEFLYGSSQSADQLLSLARCPNVGIGLMGIIGIGWWSRQLWGKRGGAISMLLAAFDPNLVAHASLVTTDVAAATFNLLTLASFYSYLVSPSWRWLIVSSLTLGLAVTSKFSLVALPCVLLIVFTTTWVVRRKTDLLRVTSMRKCDVGQPHRFPHPGPLIAAVVGAQIVCAIVWAVYLFHDVTHFEEGLRRVLAHDARGHPAFFLGHYSQTGWLLYFPVAFMLKVPVGSLFCFLLGLSLYRGCEHIKTLHVTALLLPTMLFAVILTQAQINIGIRHMLHVLPLVYVIAGGCVQLGRRVRPLIVFAITATVTSSLANLPHQLTYFNEIVGGPSYGNQYLSDSNLDWGQDLRNLSDYLQDRPGAFVYLAYFGSAPPEYYGIRYQHIPTFGSILPPADNPIDGPTEELLVISKYAQLAVWADDHSQYEWLHDRQPQATIGHSISVYDITDDSQAHRYLAEVYQAHGLSEYARLETLKAEHGGNYSK